MQIEVYDMQATRSEISITLEAVCDSFSSLLWDIEYYQCGQFEIFIAANPRNLAIFQIGKIIGRDDDKTHFGIIESVSLETNTENGDYLTVTGRFLMSLLSRRIIYPTLSFTSKTSYGEIVQKAVQQNCMMNGSRLIPGLKIGSVSGTCWEQTVRLQVSYDNLMEWIYKICELTGGTANIRLQETTTDSGQYCMIFELSEGTDRSILQEENPHMIFSDSYNNLLNFDYSADCSEHTNTAYILGCGEGENRKRMIFFDGKEPEGLERREIYVDAKDIQQETQENDETIIISDEEYLGLLQEKGAENLVPITETSESTIAVDNRQYQYNKDYFLGDYVTVEHKRFGLSQPKIQLIGMVESFDQNGRGLTPTFKI
ncbi:MAG: siphovirus ReqiPepy6 Gp37-like family protein [Oscillospiraceae bacterium]|nr:siphovirus ReqiPepy6 Gp37-like family protein [Oscillospiraceae bacterium]